MKKKKSSLIFVVGICLVLVSVAFFAGFELRMVMGARHSQTIAAKLDEILPERTAGGVGMYPAANMPVLEVENTDYVAMVEIPSFGITLPVADGWNSNKLSASPARFCGSAYDGSLVIGGADDPRQFGFCEQIANGAMVIVTDMTGVQFTYTVTGVDRAKHAETQWLTEEGCDLTLFCHDIYAMEYIAVRCVFAYR